MACKCERSSTSPLQKTLSKSPLILVLYTGGTIGMQQNEQDGEILLYIIGGVIFVSHF